MIRYFITKANLEAKVELVKKGWLGRAVARTTSFTKLSPPRYEEKSNIWSEIKEAFLKLQHDKCAYCERQLGGKNNLKEYDIEHYRPKSSVKLWPTEAIKLERKLVDYDFPLGDDSEQGYYLLAYNVCNYAVSCTGCNSSFKSNYFPVAAPRAFGTDDYALLRNEEPYLLCPVGDTDVDDPEDVITFLGFLPIPKEQFGRKYRRGRVTIDFFDLAVRDELIRERAKIITDLWNDHEILNQKYVSQELKDSAQRRIDDAISARSPHTNCARAYHRLCLDDHTQAREWKELAMCHREKLEDQEYLDNLVLTIRDSQRSSTEPSIFRFFFEALGFRRG
jgi:hypothetical protein